MKNFHQETGKVSLLTIVLVIGVVVVFATINFLLLRGEPVRRELLDSPGALTFQPELDAGRYVVELYTTEKRQLNYTIYGPDDAEIDSGQDQNAKKSRSLAFIPSQEGSHSIQVEPAESAGGSGSVEVQILKNDRRIFRFF